MVLVSALAITIHAQEPEKKDKHKKEKKEEAWMYGKCQSVLRSGETCGKCVEITGDKFCKHHQESKQKKQSQMPKKH
jgi:hypothetical protein